MAAIGLGDTGPAVVEWQRFLGVAADGVFGPDTDGATRTFQCGKGLAADGVAGPLTLAAARAWLEGSDVKAWPWILGGLSLAALAALSRTARAAGGPLSAHDERMLEPLLPCVADRARVFLWNAFEAGLELRITSGYRSSAEQGRLYEQGRTTDGPIVTNAPAGRSWHNHRLAFDVAPVDASGQPHWPEDVALWDQIGALGKAAGLEWGGDWKSFQDRPHFQYTDGLTLDQAIAGRLPHGC